LTFDKKKVTLCRVVVNIGNSLVNDSRIVMQVVVDLALLVEQEMDCISRLNLNCDYQVGFGVESVKYL
jgi:hypothetical protein